MLILSGRGEGRGGGQARGGGRGGGGQQRGGCAPPATALLPHGGLSLDAAFGLCTGLYAPVTCRARESTSL
jgi:hypothetical protein